MLERVPGLKLISQCGVYPDLTWRPVRGVHRCLIELEALIVNTSHADIGYVTREDYEIQFGNIFDQINAYADGKPVNAVNFAVLGAG